MNFVDLSTLNITTELETLKRGTQRYSLFLYQHKGVFFADNSRIGNSNQNEAETKFINLLKKARNENISLVISPEYSCPKSVIESIIEDENMQPPQHKIWALGGESLSKEDLNNLNNIENEGVYIYFEDVCSNSDKNYVDPLYYIFRGQHNGIEKLVILIQFKSNHMGGLWSSQLEPNNLIQGNNVYIIKNNEHSVRLMSFICSQAMNFDAALETDLIENHSWTDSPFMFLNLQFNPDPSHQNFIAFRQFALNKEKRELITINWGLETTFSNGEYLYRDNNAPRSGIYFKTSDAELDYKPRKIIDNHQKGLYFLQIKRNKRVYFLNRNIELFKIYNKSVHIIEGVDEQQRREGPTVSNIFNFGENLDFAEIETATENHINFLTTRGVTNAYLLNQENSIVDKERLLNISTGKVKGKEENRWADVIHLNSFILNETSECNNRLTYIEDTYPSSEAVRATNCTNIIELDRSILPNNQLYPHSIKRFRDKNLQLSYSSDASDYNYKYNVVNQDGNIEIATICYVGNASDRDVNSTYDELQKLFDKGTKGKETIVVYYKRGIAYKEKSDPAAGDITQIPKDNSSIL
jgi:hypothetical protein